MSRALRVLFIILLGIAPSPARAQPTPDEFYAPFAALVAVEAGLIRCGKLKARVLKAAYHPLAVLMEKAARRKTKASAAELAAARAPLTGPGTVIDACVVRTPAEISSRLEEEVGTLSDYYSEKDDAFLFYWTSYHAAGAGHCVARRADPAEKNAWAIDLGNLTTNVVTPLDSRFPDMKYAEQFKAFPRVIKAFGPPDPCDDQMLSDLLRDIGRDSLILQKRLQ